MTYGDPFGAFAYGDTLVPPSAPQPGPSERILFLSPRDFDQATLTASSAVASLPVTYLQDIAPERIWRSQSKTGQYIVISARARAYNSMAIIHHLTGAALFRVTGAPTADTLDAPIVNTGWVSAWPITGQPLVDDWPAWASLIRWSNEIALGAWKLEIADTGVATDSLELVRVYLDRGFQPSANVDTNVVIGLDSPDAQVRTEFAKVWTDPRGPSPRRFTLNFSAIDKDDLLQCFFELQRYCGLARDFFVVIDPAATTEFHTFAMRGVFTSPAQFEAQPIYDHRGELWRSTLTITEIL